MTSVVARELELRARRPHALGFEVDQGDVVAEDAIAAGWQHRFGVDQHSDAPADRA